MGEKVKIDWRDLSLRFIMGGGAVAACYVLSVVLPWKAFAGIFAAFPAVMIAAVSIAGLSEGSGSAAEVAAGAVCGMSGCTTCVLASIFLMEYFGSWQVGMTLSLIVWYISSILYFRILGCFFTKKTAKD